MSLRDKRVKICWVIELITATPLVYLVHLAHKSQRRKRRLKSVLFLSTVRGISDFQQLKQKKKTLSTSSYMSCHIIILLWIFLKVHQRTFRLNPHCVKAKGLFLIRLNRWCHKWQLCLCHGSLWPLNGALVKYYPRLWPLKMWQEEKKSLQWAQRLYRLFETPKTGDLKWHDPE